MAVSGGAKAENPRVDGTDARFHALVSQRQRNTLEERDSEGSNPSAATTSASYPNRQRNTAQTRDSQGSNPWGATTGYSAAWLAHSSGRREVVGSNPTTPTTSAAWSSW